MRRVIRSGAGLALVVVACTAEESERFAVAITARGADEAPLAGVRVWLDGHDLGSSDSRGRVEGSVTARDGEVASLAVACPPDHRAELPTRVVPLRRVDLSSGSSPAIEIDARCEPVARPTPLVVYATGPGVLEFPVSLRGETIAHTDATGTAHALLALDPAEIVHVSIDTSSRPELRPASPVHTLRREDTDTILLVAQHFDAPAPRRARPRAPFPAASLAPSERPRPYRIR